MFGRLRWNRIILNVGIFIYVVLIYYALTNNNPRCIEDMSPKVTDVLFQQDTCKIDYDNLELNNVDIFHHPEFEVIEAINPEIEAGGKWAPKDCTAWQKVAIIVPFRDRLDHLKLLLHILHPFLRRQKIDYQIFVVEQAGNEQFNRGRLMNIGVTEALKEQKFDCFIFHDVDLLPEHQKNVYYCDAHARHLASAIDEMRYHVMFYNYAGGVIAVNKANIFKVNGYGNDYWGWGSEDDDFSARTMGAELKLSRPPPHIGRFKMVRHSKSWGAANRHNLFLTWRSRWKSDGLNNIQSKYQLVEKEHLKLYTKIIADVGKPPDKPPIDEHSHSESLIWFLQFFYP